MNARAMPVLPLVGSTMRVRADAVFGFRRRDHGRADAVFDAAQGVEKFEFGVNGGIETAAVRLSFTSGVRPMVSAIWACMAMGNSPVAPDRLRTLFVDELGGLQHDAGVGRYDSVNQTLPPMVVLAPMTVSPPRMVAPE
jgi:hypothetical protein